MSKKLITVKYQIINQNQISNLISVNRSITKVWTNNIPQYKARERILFKWLSTSFRKKDNFVKILSKINSFVVQTEIQNNILLNLWKGFM